MGCKRRLVGVRSRPQTDGDVWKGWLAVMVLITVVSLPCTEAFSLRMDYQPPVKSSVDRIRRSRRSRVSTSHKSAYAGTLAPPAPPRSFEKRMRDLVLPKAKPSLAPAPAARPANFKTVKTLLDFKTVVADEPEKIVAVRFYSPYCRVRIFELLSSMQLQCRISFTHFLSSFCCNSGL